VFARRPLFGELTIGESMPEAFFTARIQHNDLGSIDAEIIEEYLNPAAFAVKRAE
jgi:hypothetical protein